MTELLKDLFINYVSSSIVYAEKEELKSQKTER